MAYDPYFSIGDAVAALGIFLLIPQFLKPIYIFRLRVIGIGLRTLYAVSGVGFLCVLAGAVAAQTTGVFPSPINAPLVWETAAGILFSVAYGVLGWVYIFPPRAGIRSIDKYVRAGANFLAGATDEDRVEFAADIVANIPKLIRIADMTGSTEPPAAMPADGLRKSGPAEFASYSESFLRVLSDPVFCRTMVERLPWDGARILRAFALQRPKAPVGQAFVRQLARNSLIYGEAGSAKAVDWHSFTDAPELADAAFGNAFLNRHYLPWESLATTDFDGIDEECMVRIQHAAQLTIDEHVGCRFAYQSYNIAGMQENFEILSRRILALKRTENDILALAGVLGRTVKYVVDATRQFCQRTSPEDRRSLYAHPDQGRDPTSLNSVAELVICVLENTSHDFSGFDDKFWPMARDIWDSILPRFGEQPPGVDPLQQRFILRLIEKTEENLEGWFSPLSRQALAIIGPYSAKGETANETAFKICRNLFYQKLKEFPAFYERDPDRAKTFLPGNVRYDSDTKELIHRYSFGGEDRTNLSALNIPATSLEIETVANPAID